MRLICLLIILVLTLGVIPIHAQDSAACTLDTQEAYVQRGNTRLNQKDYAASLADFNCALALNDSNVDALFGRAYSYYELGESTKAEADYTRVIQLNPTEAGAYNNRGIIYYDRGDYDKARADYDRAIALPYTEKYIPYYNRGSLNYQVGDYQAAIADVSEAINLNTADSDSYLLRAAVYQAMGDQAALADILQYVDLIRKVSGSENAADFTAGKVLSLSPGTVYNIPIEAKNGQVIRAAANAPAESKADPLLVLLSPDGKAVSWDDDSGVNLDAVLRYTFPADGSYTLLLTQASDNDGTVTLTLSQTGEGAAPTSDIPSNIFQVYNLAVNDPATVFSSGGNHLNLRSGPGLNFDILAKLDRDTGVTLLEGPRKSDGYNWWRIRTEDGREGWAVERVEEEQTLYAALKAGLQAQVTTQGSLRLRQGAGQNFTVIVELHQSDLVTLLEGPQSADNFSWWKIRTADGQEGWAVESVREERTLALSDAASG